MFIVYKKYVTITINTEFVEYKNKIYIKYLNLSQIPVCQQFK